MQKRSTNQALNVLLDKITAALDTCVIVLGVFLDFSKAFDTVDHQILSTYKVKRHFFDTAVGPRPNFARMCA